MSCRGWALFPLATFMSLPLFFPSATADPIVTPFDYTFDLVFINFWVNGFILLFLYVHLVRMGAKPLPVEPRRFFAIFLQSVLIITFSGAIIDSIAFVGGTVSVSVVALALIMMTCILVSYRYLGMPLREAALIGVVFLVVNATMWAVLSEDIIWLGWDNPVLFILLDLAFIYALAIVSSKYHDIGRPSWRYDAMPRDDGTPRGKTPVANPNPLDRLTYLWVESLALCCVLFFLAISSIAFWIMI